MPCRALRAVHSKLCTLRCTAYVLVHAMVYTPSCTRCVVHAMLYILNAVLYTLAIRVAERRRTKGALTGHNKDLSLVRALTGHNKDLSLVR